MTKKIPENSRAIAAAREQGDLRENAGYKMAKQDQQLLIAQKSQLERDLARARITDFKDAGTDRISVGSVVELREGATGQSVRYTVLGLWDGDPEKHIISYKSPLGQALLSKKPGDHVKVKSGGAEHDYAVTGISAFVNAPPAAT